MLSPVKTMVLSSILQQFLRRWGVTQVKKIENNAKETMVSEVSALAVKALAGLMIVSLVIFAAARLIDEVSIYFGQFYYGRIYNVALFAGVVILGFGALYAVFAPKKDKNEGVVNLEEKDFAESLPASLENIDPQHLVHVFVNGFSAGFKRSRQQRLYVVGSDAAFDSVTHPNQ